ncbi:MAG: deoxyribodipyrimidine photo-lyase [Polyangiaceae bacterium]|nr:deoxyribodipyrimidine photo-lyase [Polyangiaceae bacterium]
MTRTIVWFRHHDLRLSDHVPLCSALSAGEVIPLFVLDPPWSSAGRARQRPHRTQFLLDSLGLLAEDLRERGSRLLVVAGPSIGVLPTLIEDWKADRIVAHRETDPNGRQQDQELESVLGPRLALFGGSTLLPPGTLRSAAQTPYAVFSAFARAWWASLTLGKVLPAPRRLPPVPRGLRSTALPALAALGLAQNPALLPGGERAARHRLRRFVASALSNYAEDRDRLDRTGTSRLSADLVTGTVSVREVWNTVERASSTSEGARSFLNELVWREFAYSTLWDRPDILTGPFRTAFSGFPWRDDEAGWQAWTEGTTGYPVVDAAARQLLGEGFVPNRARMIAASFLTKHLLIDYRRGEAHYLTLLADGDPANNNLGWQWSAGCGCDAQPYYRVFNPVLQGERHDPEGSYVRRWVPELRRLPARHIHRPWEAPAATLRDAGVRLGKDYPQPIVAHRFVRERFVSLANSHLAAARAR